MVYNAMKLFMEINPQLFDDCSHDYTEVQNNVDRVQSERQSKWEKVADRAKQVQAGATFTSMRSAGSTRSGKVGSPMRIDEIDPATQDSQKRLDALRLQDDGAPKEYRDGGRRKDHERQNSVGSQR